MTNSINASFMVTCLGDLFFPEVGLSVVRLLRSVGVTVNVPRDQTCCGLPLFNSGYREDAARVARRTLSLFADSEHVVVPSGSCAVMVKHEYPKLLTDPGLNRQARELASRTYELSQFLVNVLKISSLQSEWTERITYHDSCHLLRGLGESASPRTLLKAAGGTYVDLPEANECCGFGGSFSVRLPDVSAAMLKKKLDAIERSGADCVVACDAGCLMQIRGGLSRRGSRVQARHLAEVLCPSENRHAVS